MIRRLLDTREGAALSRWTYNVERTATPFDPRGGDARPHRALRRRRFLAAAPSDQRQPPLLVDSRPTTTTTHVLAVYRERGLWGRSRQSKFSWSAVFARRVSHDQRARDELFEDYFNWEGDRTLRAYSRPLSLTRFDRIGWMTAEEDLWPVVEWLAVANHRPLVGASVAKRLPRVDRRSFQSGVLGAPKH